MWPLAARAEDPALRRRAWRPHVLGARQISIWLLMSGAIAGAGAGAAADIPAAAEYRLKADSLYNLAKFVEWPAGSFASSSAPFRFCLVGVDPFGDGLETSLRGKTLRGRALVIRRGASEARMGGCHVLFVGASEQARLAPIVGRVSPGMLTVADLPGFTEHGGMVRLVMEDGKVRFEINPDVAEKAHLRISSKLLKLARIVR